MKTTSINLFKTIALTILLSVPSWMLYAQENQPAPASPQKEKIEALKMGYISKELDLSPEEAQKFWPVYNQYQKELDAAKKNAKKGSANTSQKTDKSSDEEPLFLS